jgi:hypothetical protein
LPELEKVRRKFEPRGVRFVALSLEPDRELVERAARKLQIQMPIALAKTETLAPLGVNQVPSTVFINSTGVIVAAASGERSRSFLEARIEELLH